VALVMMLFRNEPITQAQPQAMTPSVLRIAAPPANPEMNGELTQVRA